MPYQSTMAQQMPRLRLLVLLLLLWLAACHSTKSEAVLFDVQMAGSDGFKVNGNADGDAAGGSGSSNGVVAVTSDANYCFEIYSQDSRQASNTYASAYRICRDFGNAQHMKAIEKQLSVRQDVTLAMNEMCKASYECSHIDGDLAFFQCNSKNSYNNVNTILQVYLNSTLAIVELENKYQEAEKEILLCIIAAEEQYINATSRAYVRLSKCLRAI